MTPSDITADSYASWLYAVAALRAQHLAAKEGRTLTTEELIRAADRIVTNDGKMGVG